MDKCLRVVAFVAIASSFASGLPYRNSYENNYRFGHYQPSRGYQRPYYYQREHNFHKDHPYNKEDWSHHSPEWHSGSWEYPDFPNEKPDSWHHHGWNNNHEAVNHWPHGNPQVRPNQEGPSWPGRPTWNQANTWGQNQNPTTTPRSTATGSGSDLLAQTQCIRSCPVTSEYNPVCGSNNVTYSNPGRLECAKYCGVAVTLQRNSACPMATADNPPTQTTRPSRPVQPQTTLPPPKPTRFTTVVFPATNGPPVLTNPPATISQDILNNIFTPSSTTVDEGYDIDIRTS